MDGHIGNDNFKNVVTKSLDYLNIQSIMNPSEVKVLKKGLFREF